jgi:hypothetical protein
MFLVRVRSLAHELIGATTKVLEHQMKAIAYFRVPLHSSSSDVPECIRVFSYYFVICLFVRVFMYVCVCLLMGIAGCEDPSGQGEIP